MQSCSKEFTPRFSKPKMSKMPTQEATAAVGVTLSVAGCRLVLILLSAHSKTRL